jgi:putative sterol carrier protein
MPTVREIFERMPESFDPRAAASVDAVIPVAIKGEGGGCWLARVSRGELTIVEGSSDEASLTISASARDYVLISTGELNEQLAFMTGRITARGDTALAMKLPRIFRR